MARLLATVLATIEQPVAKICALEVSSPLFHNRRATISRVNPLARHIVVSVAAEYRFLFFSAIATAVDSHLAGAAESLMALTLTGVFTAG